MHLITLHYDDKVLVEKVKISITFLLGKMTFLATRTTHWPVFVIHKNLQNKVFKLKYL